MTTDNIVEIGIDNQGRLYVKPEIENFEFIYRAAAEVNWDEKRKFLYSPKPKEYTYVDWFKQIIMATKSEYGCQLVLTPMTTWTNISDELKNKILL